MAEDEERVDRGELMEESTVPNGKNLLLNLHWFMSSYLKQQA